MEILQTVMVEVALVRSNQAIHARELPVIALSAVMDQLEALKFVTTEILIMGMGEVIYEQLKLITSDLETLLFASYEGMV